ncbi:hypothetical protein DRZ78_01685 [Candidatus Aerophobetes bacterium]|uniref:Uncharacterized protein n=1 Tax=Aerophobetes bacterium TaxID=2030807 RepID=A0A662D512_UNCAE|nr:MAG: hypothetical protein DRZ78_01685 [Candidatus Aerophobetes bacterium]
MKGPRCPYCGRVSTRRDYRGENYEVWFCEHCEVPILKFPYLGFGWPGCPRCGKSEHWSIAVSHIHQSLVEIWWRCTNCDELIITLYPLGMVKRAK